MVGVVETTLQFIALLGAAVAALAVIWTKAIAPVLRWGRHLKHEVDHMRDVINKELTPNGGHSMKDHVRKTHEALEALDARVTHIELEGAPVGGRRATDPHVIKAPPVVVTPTTIDPPHAQRRPD